MKTVSLLLLAALAMVAILCCPILAAESIGEPIKIGAVIPLTGELAKFGEMQKNSFLMALEEINRAGGVRGRKLELIIEDDTGKPEVGRSAVEKLISRDKIAVLTGGYSSSVTYGIAGTAQQRKIPYVTHTGAADNITEMGWDYVFRINQPASEYFKGLLSFLGEVVKPKTAVVIHENTLFGQSQGKSFAEACQPLGCKVLFRDSYESGAVDFKPLVTKMKAANPDLVLEKEPMVLQVAPGVLGMIDDAYFRHVTDVGLTGPDQGKGGKYLLVPPGYAGALPGEGYVVCKPRTYNNLVIMRSFVKEGDVAGAVKNVKDNTRVYALSAPSDPPQQKFVNISGMKFNTVHANDVHFYDELNAVVQHEPADFVDPETVGLFASIGIKKGKPFAPDARMKAILIDSAAVANATVRAILFASRDERTRYYPDRQWYTTFPGGRYQFADGAERLLDARTMFHYYATGITPSMVAAKPGTGSAYAIAARDSQGRYFDGGKTYKVTLPTPVPAARFWSFTIYDNQTRSMLETDQILAGLDSTMPGLKKNADGSVTVWFGPKAPAGQQGNWVQTMPGKSWNTLFRLYGPLEPWINKTWKPGDFELVK